MHVLIPTSLRSYTKASRVEVVATTLREVIADLDRQFPGMGFRMLDEQDRLRPHIRVFVNGKPARDLGQVLQPTDDVGIVQALSGG